jgi:hypothetical protein
LNDPKDKGKRAAYTLLRRKKLCRFLVFNAISYMGNDCLQFLQSLAGTYGGLLACMGYFGRLHNANILFCHNGILAFRRAP